MVMSGVREMTLAEEIRNLAELAEKEIIIRVLTTHIREKELL